MLVSAPSLFFHLFVLHVDHLPLHAMHATAEVSLSELSGNRCTLSPVNKLTSCCTTLPKPLLHNIVFLAFGPLFAAEEEAEGEETSIRIPERLREGRTLCRRAWLPLQASAKHQQP